MSCCARCRFGVQALVGEHHHAGAVAGHELGVVQELDRGNEEREGLTGARARGAEYVAASEEGQDGPRLHLGHPSVPSSEMPAMVCLERVRESKVLSLRIPSARTWMCSPLRASFSGVASSSSSVPPRRRSPRQRRRPAPPSFLLRRLPLLVVHAGHRRRLSLLALALLGGELRLFFIVRRALSSSADSPEPPMVGLGRGLPRQVCRAAAAREAEVGGDSTVEPV